MVEGSYIGGGASLPVTVDHLRQNCCHFSWGDVINMSLDVIK